MSEDLVPVNISAVTEAPPKGADAQQQAAHQSNIVFHVTAYNSQVEKILDVRLVQPGRKLYKLGTYVHVDC